MINCILLYAYGAPNFLMKSTGLAEMGSDVGVDSGVDWDPQVFATLVFEAVEVILGSFDYMAYMMVFEWLGIHCVSGIT